MERRASRLWIPGSRKSAPRNDAAYDSNPKTAKLAIAIGEVTLLYGKDGSCLDIDVACETQPPGHVLDPCIIAAGLDAGDAQPLVGIHRAILVVLALVLAPFGRAGGGELKFRDGVMCQIPEPRGALGRKRAGDGDDERQDGKCSLVHGFLRNFTLR